MAMFLPSTEGHRRQRRGLGHSKLDLFSSSTALRVPGGTAFCFYYCPGVVIHLLHGEVSYLTSA